MSADDSVKLIPRNVAALRVGDGGSAVRQVPGNTVSTRLESGIGNCYPGLECDLRNLERRFFPFLTVDAEDGGLLVVGVDLAGVNRARSAGTIPAASATAYRTIATGTWRVIAIEGDFGPLGLRTVDLAALGTQSADGSSFGPDRGPSTPWTAVRLLVEDSTVTITLRGARNRRVSLAGRRARYLDDSGALAAMFQPGELTQSLCRPWTHDFRDCACFYWASNHPDIALPPKPAQGAEAADWNAFVPWERSDQVVRPAPPPPATRADPRAVELDYHEINHAWQTLNFVVDGRERLDPYEPGRITGTALASRDALVATLRYAAGVELSVMQEYLSAAYSLNLDVTGQPLADDVHAAYAEIKRVAIGEMRHLRLVNDVLAGLAPAGSFAPALRAARRLPAGSGQALRDKTFAAATPETIARFIDIERAAHAVDVLYANVLATLDTMGTESQRQSIRTIMAEGEEHLETFLFVQEWLARHAPSEYLRRVDLAAPPRGNAAHSALQREYRVVLGLIHDGYTRGLPAGAGQIGQARLDMVGTDGVDQLALAVAQLGFLVVFDDIAGDARFSPIDPP